MTKVVNTDPLRELIEWKKRLPPGGRILWVLNWILVGTGIGFLIRAML